MMIQLHDDGEKTSLDVFPPILWNDFKLTNRKDILDHYYSFSAGCKTPTLFGGIAMATVGLTAAAFAPAIGAAVAKSLTTAKAAGGAKAVASATAKKSFIAKAKSQISSGAKAAMVNESSKAANTARQKSRKLLDSGSERDRIVENYKRMYARLDSNNFQNRMSSKTLSELQTELVNQKRILKESEKKCSKMPCDTAGCRSMGSLTLRMQYVQALIKAYQSSGTSTPEEYNAKFSKAVDEGKTSLAGFSFGLPFLIILGAALAMFRKK
jgi:hypothetical protein